MTLLACSRIGAQVTKAQLEVSETFFTLAAALNGCGYDAGLQESVPLRQTVRAELQSAVQKSPEASRSLQAICRFEQEHLPKADAARNIPQYISLAMELGPPPALAPTLPEADLPNDAAYVLGVVPLLRNFYQAAGMHALWLRHQAEYEALVKQFHDPVAEAITRTDLYLKLPFGNYVGRRFIVYLEPLLAPTQVNSRNYGDNYFLEVSPSRDGSLRLQEIRHTYLHYALDPLALTHARSLKRLEPLLDTVKSAPMDKAFKNEISLLVNESLIRAVEIRMLPLPRSEESERRDYVQQSMEEGYVLTRYFYDTLVKFEKESSGLRDSYGDFLYNIDLDREKRHAREITFAAEAPPEIVTSVRPVRHEEHLLDDAEQRLASGDAAGAQQLAQRVLNNNKSMEDSGRAAFIMARAALLSRDIEGARFDFEQAVASAHDPRTLAWSHIYLGRIFDIQDKRDQALAHYRAALQAGDPTPDTKAAAEKGLAAPFEPPKAEMK